LTKKLTATALQYQEQGAKIQERQQLLQETNQKLHTLDQQITTQSGKLTSLEHKVQEKFRASRPGKETSMELGLDLVNWKNSTIYLWAIFPSGENHRRLLPHFFKFVLL